MQAHQAALALEKQHGVALRAIRKPSALIKKEWQKEGEPNRGYWRLRVTS